MKCKMQIFNLNFRGLWLVLSSFWVLGGGLMFLSAFSSLKESSMLVLSAKLSISNLELEVSGLGDFYSMSFSGVVMMISGSVYLYSLSYMETEKYFNRFMTLVSLFIFSMLVLIYSGDVVQLILGWDGLGLSSYLLVCYYNNSNSSNAGALTLMLNRLGDVGLFLSIYVMVNSSHSINSFMSISSVMGSLLLFVAFTKSAQLPFSAWLPAAMAAPTPVSSLVHSSTLVTAGVYVLIRFYDSLISVLWISLIVGVSTSSLATLVAMAERDMKKIVAFSTLSHLGIMMSILSLGWVELAFSHLIFHAFFKALLFLVVGYWIHSSCGYQDLLKINLLSSQEPVISTLGGVSLMSLCGLPYLTGFYSKDLFMEVSVQFSSSLLGLGFILSSCVGSVMYSIRMFLMVNKVGSVSSLLNWGGSFKFYQLSMSLLYFFSIMGGSFWSNFWVTSGSVLYVFWEVKMVIISLITCSGLLGAYLSNTGVKNSFLSKLGYLSDMSIRLPNILSKSLMSKSVKLDNSFLSSHYNKYYSVEGGKYLLNSGNLSYSELILVMFFFYVMLYVLSG
ncbi:NADH dehydrogenase subunit 5 (mitochondrion) [Lepeophtheirus salmonis]|uniref:NADH-ubiquinone oxidoreductase chain 5 n=1 Tax=Lepeophtheirus salmonis TaxID=72036 RepID=A0A1M4NER4_LEPSM|nr:NADH dehydrogenase subunit 5 [Lepeophtheirus salmonis]CAF3048450.1 NADH dehydrogenase subunit 5 [Lepeophtheirus salmonis]CAH1385107.1 NADH dehydrogenase subunit 5 [Lepeophtheirus salmonis]SFW10608.1 NADH dehydrogenase subunit 5 [Lepeophtheirus salmonis]